MSWPVCLCVTFLLSAAVGLPMANDVSLAETDVAKTRRIERAERPAGSKWGVRPCTYQGLHADCSNRGILFRIPELPSDITSLDISCNLIYTIEDATFFANITAVTTLDLSRNLIKYIGSSAFQLMTNLTHLVLSDNPLNCRDLSVVFQIPTLEVLIMEGRKDCDNLVYTDIRGFMPRLQELDLSGSGFTLLVLTSLSPFTGLRRVILQFLSDCNIMAFEAFHRMTNLTYLDLSFSRVQCHHLSTLLTTPSLKVLLLNGSLPDDCKSCPNPARVWPPVVTLEVLSFGGGFYVLANLTCLSSFTAGLKRLNLNRVNQIGAEPSFLFNYESLHQLSNLTYLDLSNNWLSCNDLLTAMTIPSLEELVAVSSTVCAQLDASKRLLNTTQLQRMNLRQNSLESIWSLSKFTKLRYLDLSNNRVLYYGKPGKHVSYIQTLDLHNNRFMEFPETCGNGSSLFPRLLELDLSENDLFFVEPVRTRNVCLEQLQSLNLRANQLLSRITTSFENIQLTFTVFERLESLDISVQKNNLFHFRPNLLGDDTFRNPHLTSLNLAYNYIPFKDERYVSINTFSGCHNLLNLSLSSNDFKGVSEERFVQLFGHLVHLTHLSLRSAGIGFIFTPMFQTLQSLKCIDLSDNSFFLLPDALFPSLPQLTMLNLSSNKISVVKKSAFSLKTSRLQHIDLRFNPFFCSCEVLWFQNWLRVSPDLFVGNFSDYTCGNLPDTPVTSFYKRPQACLLSPETSKFIIATISLIFIGMSLLSFLYRYRWHIRLILHEVFRGPEERRRRLREHRFQYDLFVSYDSEDFPWVSDHLMPSLEEDMGLKLCLHQRDFIPGYPIAENIMDSVQSSKKLLMLFSRSFAQSQWCQFELQLCLSHAMDTQDVLIIVMLEDIPSRDLTPAMMAVMKTTTYIEWADEADARDSFWRRMGLALHEVMPFA